MGGGGVIDIKRDSMGNVITYNFKLNKIMVWTSILLSMGGLVVGFDNG